MRIINPSSFLHQYLPVAESPQPPLQSHHTPDTLPKVTQMRLLPFLLLKNRI